MIDPKNLKPGAIVRRDFNPPGAIWRVVRADGNSQAILWPYVTEHVNHLVNADYTAEHYQRIPDADVPQEVWTALAKLRLEGG